MDQTMVLLPDDPEIETGGFRDGFAAWQETSIAGLRDRLPPQVRHRGIGEPGFRYYRLRSRLYFSGKLSAGTCQGASSQ